MKKVHINIINKSHHPLPAYGTQDAACMDLRAFIETTQTLKPLQRIIIGTGLYMGLPSGYEALIRPRSGLAAKYGITVLNTPGTIDADYRGEIKVLLINLSDQPFDIKDGDRIAQLAIKACTRVTWVSVNQLEPTPRGAGGYGSTGRS